MRQLILAPCLLGAGLPQTTLAAGATRHYGFPAHSFAPIVVPLVRT